MVSRINYSEQNVCTKRESCKEKYGCEVIIDNGTLDDVSIKHVPTDACIVKYLFEDKVRFDLTI